jgi:hypothetical protein
MAGLRVVVVQTMIAITARKTTAAARLSDRVSVLVIDIIASTLA